MQKATLSQPPTSQYASENFTRVAIVFTPIIRWKINIHLPSSLRIHRLMALSQQTSSRFAHSVMVLPPLIDGAAATIGNKDVVDEEEEVEDEVKDV